MQRARNVIRWIFLVVALAYAAWCAPVLFHNFREWRASIPGDPLAATFWRSAFYAGITDIVIVLAIGIVTWLALKSRRRSGAPSARV